MKKLNGTQQKSRQEIRKISMKRASAYRSSTKKSVLANTPFWMWFWTRALDRKALASGWLWQKWWR